MVRTRQKQPHASHAAPATVWRHFYEARLNLTERAQRDFETSRAQFVLSEEGSSPAAAWQQAADALDRAYEACARHENIAIVSELCTLVTKYIAIAVEKSILQSAQHSASYNA